MQAGLNPIQLRHLEELRSLQLTEQILLRHRFLRMGLQLIENEAFEQLLIRHANFHWLIRLAILHVPVLDQDFPSASHVAGPTVVRGWSPPEGDAVRGVFIFEVFLCEEGFNIIGKLELVIVSAVGSKNYECILQLKPSGRNGIMRGPK